MKKEILKLMETYVKKAEDLDAVNTNFMPPLLDAILGDYSRNVPASRDAEVLNVMTTIIGRLGVRLSFSWMARWLKSNTIVHLTAPSYPSSTCNHGSRFRTDLEHD